MNNLGWPQLVASVSIPVPADWHSWRSFHRLCNDLSPEIQEQAMSILRNLTENEEGIDYVFDSLDTETLANCIIIGLESSNEDVVYHVILNFICLENLANAAP
jgi:hypothetical protein